MAQKPGFDMSKMSTADKILGGAGLLLLIDLFLTWNRICSGAFGDIANECGGVSGWHGLGVLVGILDVALLVWIGLKVAGVNLNMPVNESLLAAGLAGAVFLFTLIRVLVKPSLFVVSLGQYIFAWVGLVLAIAVLYGGYMKFQESKAATPPPAAPGGGFTA